MKDFRTTFAAELLVRVSPDDPAPMHAQLERELRAAVRGGRLAPDMPLPSTRLLAAELGVSRGVVVEAYEQLVAEGYLVGRHGSGTRVASRAIPPVPEPRRAPRESPIRVDFRPGRPDVSEFPRASWLRSLKRVLNEAPADRFGYGDGRGLLEVRQALAGYLNRVRGTAADPDRVVISNGYSQALALICGVLHASGARRLAIEEPSYEGARAIARAAGLDLVPVPVDEDGLQLDDLERSGADAVLVTPAHQYPTGGVLPAQCRAELAKWAVRNDALIIEDDYDAEYRYDRVPIGAIQGIAPNRVVYAGSASKTLAPGLRLGWMLVPASLVDRVAGAKVAADHGSAALEQLAFADFLERGELDRHLRRMRPIYRRRRDALVATLAEHLPQLRVTGTAAGLHLLAWLPDGLDETAIVERAAAVGLVLYGLGPQRLLPGGPGGLIFGYANLTEHEISDGVRLLASVIESIGI
ncbi:MAG TPA: PLP-dependent aminotransferase family protein [Candidatus Limnocylindria bacterium]